MAGNKTRAFFFPDHPKQALESWSERIANVVEKDSIDGYLNGGYCKTPLSRLFAWVMRTFHMCFMLHVEFLEAS